MGRRPEKIDDDSGQTLVKDRGKKGYMAVWQGQWGVLQPFPFIRGALHLPGMGLLESPGHALSLPESYLVEAWSGCIQSEGFQSLSSGSFHPLCYLLLKVKRHIFIVTTKTRCRDQLQLGIFHRLKIAQFIHAGIHSFSQVFNKHLLCMYVQETMPISWESKT